jgi:hypothetical protein
MFDDHHFLRHRHGMLSGIQQLRSFHRLAYPRCLHVKFTLPLAELHNPNAAPKTAMVGRNGKLSLLPTPLRLLHRN